MTDNGAPLLAQEVTAGLHTLGILHETTLPYSPYQNAKQETFWATLEGRLMAMLDGVESLTLKRLNEVTLAWVEQAYHRDRHRELGVSPLQRYLDAPEVGRVGPDSQTLRRAFRRTAERRQRRSDGTISLAGRRYEIPGAYRTLTAVRVCYAQWDLSRVDLLDPRSGITLCPLYPLDKQANAQGQRRALDAPAAPLQSQTQDELPPLLRQCLEDYAATGRPWPYLPHPREEKTQ